MITINFLSLKLNIQKCLVNSIIYRYILLLIIILIIITIYKIIKYNL